MTRLPPLLLLFDIDGTLVFTAGAGVRGMNTAFHRLHGRESSLEGVPIAGRTDRAITIDVFNRAGIEPTESRLHAFRAEYLTCLADELAAPPHKGFGVLPGVEAVLEALRSTPHARGLLTGNFERAADLKLGRFDLARRFSFGAFGDDHVNRRDLVPVAIDRARQRGLPATPAHVVVIGDTPLDVDCAHAHGALAVAVATGNYSRAELEREGAELVLDTLDDCDAGGVWLETAFSERRLRD